MQFNITITSEPCPLSFKLYTLPITYVNLLNNVVNRLLRYLVISVLGCVNTLLLCVPLLSPVILLKDEGNCLSCTYIW